MRVETIGGTWHVRRRWAPRHLGPDTAFGRFRNRTRSAAKQARDREYPGPGCALDLAELVGLAVFAAIVVLFMVVVGFPFLLALGELVLILLLAVAGVIGRVLFRRPWTIDAVGPDGDHSTWDVVGWRPSGAARDFVADRLRQTGALPSAPEVEAATLTS